MVPVTTSPQRSQSSAVQDDRPPETNAALTQPVDEAEMPLPASPQSFFLGGLFVLASFAALYAASAIILPVVLAFVLMLLLRPAVRLLERVHLPKPLGALLIILLVVGTLVGLVAALSVPAATWAERLPQGIPRLETHLEVLKRPIQAVQVLIEKAEKATDTPGPKGTTVAIRRDLGISAVLFAGTRAVLDGLFTTVLVLYFLLVSGDIFLRRLVEILPRFSSKRQAVDIPSRLKRISQPIW